MDLRERHKDGSIIENRHPWELSRTEKVLEVFGKYLDKIHGKNGKKYVNIGAGDLYFDHRMLERYADDHVYAVDLEYDESIPDEPQVDKYHYLEEVPDGMDYGIMMDSLEYMPEDAAYVQALSRKIKKGGYLFFTLPAFPSIFSEHDRIVGNLKRYDAGGFRKLIAAVPGVELVECYYFYTSLFFVRWLQVHLRLPIDRNHKVTSYWKSSERSARTRCIVWLLNMDFSVNRMLNRMGVRMPGLSLLAVCRKAETG